MNSRFNSAIIWVFLIVPYQAFSARSEDLIREALLQAYQKTTAQYEMDVSKKLRAGYKDYENNVLKPLEENMVELLRRRVDIANLRTLQSMVRSSLVGNENIELRSDDPDFVSALNEAAAALDSDLKEVLQLSLKEPVSFEDFKDLAQIVDNRLTAAEKALAASEKEEASLKDLRSQEGRKLKELRDQADANLNQLDEQIKRIDVTSIKVRGVPVTKGPISSFARELALKDWHEQMKDRATRKNTVYRELLKLEAELATIEAERIKKEAPGKMNEWKLDPREVEELKNKVAELEKRPELAKKEHMKKPVAQSALSEIARLEVKAKEYESQLEELKENLSISDAVRAERSRLVSNEIQRINERIQNLRNQTRALDLDYVEEPSVREERLRLIEEYNTKIAQHEEAVRLAQSSTPKTGVEGGTLPWKPELNELPRLKATVDVLQSRSYESEVARLERDRLVEDYNKQIRALELLDNTIDPQLDALKSELSAEMQKLKAEREFLLMRNQFTRTQMADKYGHRNLGKYSQEDKDWLKFLDAEFNKADALFKNAQKAEEQAYNGKEITQKQVQSEKVVGLLKRIQVLEKDLVEKATPEMAVLRDLEKKESLSDANKDRLAELKRLTAKHSRLDVKKANEELSFLKPWADQGDRILAAFSEAEIAAQPKLQEYLARSYEAKKRMLSLREKIAHDSKDAALKAELSSERLALDALSKKMIVGRPMSNAEFNLQVQRRLERGDGVYESSRNPNAPLTRIIAKSDIKHGVAATKYPFSRPQAQGLSTNALLDARSQFASAKADRDLAMKNLSDHRAIMKRLDSVEIYSRSNLEKERALKKLLGDAEAKLVKADMALRQAEGSEQRAYNLSPDEKLKAARAAGAEVVTNAINAKVIPVLGVDKKGNEVMLGNRVVGGVREVDQVSRSNFHAPGRMADIVALEESEEYRFKLQDDLRTDLNSVRVKATNPGLCSILFRKLGMGR